MELIRRFLSGYSDNFLLAVSLWPVLSALLTLPILAMIYHRRGRLSILSVGSSYLSVLYFVGLACFTLYPLPDGSSGLGVTYGIPPQLNPLGFLADLAKDGVHAVPQIVANVIFFVPLGFIAGRMLRMRLRSALLFGFLVSLLIEVTQLTGIFGVYAHSYRTFDVDDLVWNTSGAVLGWGVSALLGRALPPDEFTREVTCSPGLVRRCVAFALDMLLVGLVTLTAGSLVWFATYLAGQDLDSPGVRTALDVVRWLALAVVELIIPLARQGRTLGGSFVRMTCETRRRRGGWRALFYVLRSAVIVASPVIWPVLAVFWLVKRQMPYDLVPGEDEATPAAV